MSIHRKAAAVLIHLLREDDPMRDLLDVYFNAELLSHTIEDGDWYAFDAARADVENHSNRVLEVLEGWQNEAENAVENAASERGDFLSKQDRGG